jgi:hypothetical protein
VTPQTLKLVSGKKLSVYQQIIRLPMKMSTRVTDIHRQAKVSGQERVQLQ